MEVHSVLPEERARTDKGETLPWGYRYADSSKNARQTEESGPFGRNRSIRHTSSSRRASTRQGTTPVRQKESSAVSDFTRLFTKEQAERNVPLPTPSSESIPAGTPQAENVPTECLLYGYATKNSEWKVISRFERIVSPSIICEDYPREDPDLYKNTGSPMGFNRSNITVHKNLSKEALQKSRVYRGGQHWIKVTFDSWEAAERACFYSPVEIDGFMVHCEMWTGRGPVTDAPVPKGPDGTIGELLSSKKARTVGPAAGSGKASAVAGFEQAFTTLPWSQKLPDKLFAKPGTRDDLDMDSSTTASSATATAPDQSLQVSSSNLRSRSVPHLPSQVQSADSTSQSMSRLPGVKKIVLRPVTEALPPRQNFMERVIRALPGVSWVFGFSGSPAAKKDPKSTAPEKVGLIGDGPVLKEDGTWDENGNGWYWRFWHAIDWALKTDLCGLKEE